MNAVSTIRTLQLIVVLGLAVIAANGQCVQHPNGNTAVRFHNDSSYEVSFFIDEGYSVKLRPGVTSSEFGLSPGEHLLSALADINGMQSWVHVANEFPAGYVCTWHVTDPEGTARRPEEISSAALLSGPVPVRKLL